MAYRTVLIKKCEEISLKNNQLILKKEEEISIPLEDISIILIEDLSSVISSYLLGELANYDVAVIFCDKRHNPSGILMPMHNHYKQLNIFNLQMNVKKPVLSQLWQMIVKSKIKNQNSILEELKKKDYYIEKLKSLEKDVKSDDNTNREAVAAKIYFEGLFGALFVRNRNNEDPINCALNYGYTVLMSNVARLLSMYGFNTILGIHHCSYTNQFNLASDVMEPFRPIVDRYIALNMKEIEYPLSSQNKIDLVKLLQEPIRINNENYIVEHAMEEMVISLQQAYSKNDSSLLLCPSILVKSNDRLQINEIDSDV